MLSQTTFRPKWQRSFWLLPALLGICCLGITVKSGLAWQNLPGRPAAAQLLALLVPAGPGQGQQPLAAQANQQPPGQKEPPAPTHPLIQALLQALDAFHGEGQDAKDALRNRLHQADQELRSLLGSRKEKILQLNRKPVVPVIEEPSGLPPSGTKKPAPPAGSEPGEASPTPPANTKPPVQFKSFSSASRPAEEPKTATAPEQAKASAPPAKPGEVQTVLVRALLEVLDKLTNVSEEDRRQVRQLLLEADKDLAKALESRSVPLLKPPATSGPSAKP